MQFTVAICTWNRAESLARTLEQITRLTPPACSWEVVVVNNNSGDATDEVLRHFSQRLPLRPCFEAKQGLSHARNAAVSRSNGSYIVWTDDDVLVDSEWLVAYERAIIRWPDASVLGGPIQPLFEGTPPTWLVSAWMDVADAFALRDLGPEPIKFDGARAVPFGANYVVRSLEQKKFPYDPELGRKLKSGSLGEETAVIRAILNAGGTGWWIPDAKVQHYIPKARQSIQYLRQYFKLQGKTNRNVEAVGASMLFGRPRWALRQAVQAELAFQLLRLTRDPQRWMPKLREASTSWGSWTG